MLAKARFDDQLAIALVILGALVLLFINEAGYRQSKGAMDTLVARGSSRAAVLQLTENLVNVDSNQRAYMLNGQEPLLKDVEKGNEAIRNSLERLAQAHASQPQHLAALERLRNQVQARQALLGQGVALRREGRLDQAYRLMIENDSSMELIQSLDNEMLMFEDEGRAQRRDTVYHTLLMARIGVAVMIALGLGLLLLYLRQARAMLRHQSELRQIEQASRTGLQAEVVLRTAELTDLTRYVLANREDERSRLARDLHDDLGALLTSAKLDVARIKTRIPKSSPESLELLAHLVGSLNGCVALGRKIIENLRPSALDNLGLSATLQILTDEFAKTSGIETQCQMKPVALSPSAELMVYRVVQEALTNVARYADATKVTVNLALEANAGENLMKLEVSDNGAGFDMGAKRNAGFGLLGMRFRVESEGGTLQVTSSPGEGTSVVAILPLPTLAELPSQPTTQSAYYPPQVH